MRKITRDAVNAFCQGDTFSSGNTAVTVRYDDDAVIMILHGNPIAIRYPNGQLFVQSAGWETPTTKERLNGLLDAVGCQGIYPRGRAWYWDDGTEFGDGWQVARKQS